MTVSAFRVKSDVSGKVGLIQPKGDLDLASADVLASEVKRHLDGNESETIVIDMSGVPFVDSTGLRILIQARKLAEEREVELRVERPSPQLARLVELTRTAETLNLV